MATLYKSGSCLDRGKEARGGSNLRLGASGDDARGKCTGVGFGSGGRDDDGAGPMVNCGAARVYCAALRLRCWWRRASEESDGHDGVATRVGDCGASTRSGRVM